MSIDSFDLNQIKLCKKVHGQLIVEQIIGSTYVIAIASDVLEQNNNIVNKIKCEIGLPVSGYVYDSQNDIYCIKCLDFIRLGFIPVAFCLKALNDEMWKIPIPVPEKVIKTQLNKKQKKDLDIFKKNFKPKQVKISFVQLVNAN